MDTGERLNVIGSGGVENSDPDVPLASEMIYPYTGSTYHPPISVSTGIEGTQIMDPSVFDDIINSSKPEEPMTVDWESFKGIRVKIAEFIEECCI